MQHPEPQTLQYATLLSDITTGKVKIPQFQRDFVWTLDKSAKLIDSILHGYPIGTFILWHTKEQLRSVKNLGGATLPDTPKGEYADQVLDGQQRLTSLYASIKGLKVVRDAGPKEANDKKVAKVDDFRAICVDLGPGPDDEYALVKHVKPDDDRFIPVCDLLNFGSKLYKQCPEEYHERIDEFRQRIQGYPFSVTLIKGAEIEVATEIFTRLNEGGKALTPFEIMVAKTFDADKGFDLAEKVDAFKAELKAVEFETLPDIVFLQVVAALIKGDVSKKAILGLNKE